MTVTQIPLTDLPSSPASERNKGHIGEVLNIHLNGYERVLEIGSGTGQHAEHFSQLMPWVHWQCSDQGPDLRYLNARLQWAECERLPPSIQLDVMADQWPDHTYDAVYSANTAHIMSWPMVCSMFTGVGRCLEQAGLFILYGPFRYGEKHTAVSNEQFDLQLRRRDSAMGIRDALEIEQQASISGLKLKQDIAMPANNRLLIFHRD